MDIQKNISAKMSPSVEILPDNSGAAMFVPKASHVFREDVDIHPREIDKARKYMPWGADNEMPFDILKLIEADETVSTCNIFNAELCYGAGLNYNTTAVPGLADEVEDFFDENDMQSFFLGSCFDIKTFGFAVGVIILNSAATRIVSVARREAVYCRFAPIDAKGKIPYIHYANWRKSSMPDDIESLELLDRRSPMADLRERVKRSRVRKFAFLMRIPTIDSTYYPIPYYASLFKGNWYDIKRNIGIAKLSKLKNTTPIRYHVEISEGYWRRIWAAEKITDPKKQHERIVKAKNEILEFLTSSENAGKTWFSQFATTPDGKEAHDVKITKIDDTKEGGDWATDIQEAVNMICFVMRIHSNLVGSVPGKSQSNNSGSDKRELFTIAQAMQKMYRDIIFRIHRFIIRFNGWKGVKPECPFIQLTTLDEHKDAKTVDIQNFLPHGTNAHLAGTAHNGTA